MNSKEGKQKFFVIYQITNLLDGRIYVGAHVTYNVNDKYMGSSKYLKKDMKELGRENFRKDILHVFDNMQDMISKEAEIVNRAFCYRDDTYNRVVGGMTEFSWVDTVTVKDNKGKTMKVYCDDPRYLSGELVSNMKNRRYGIDENGKIIQVNRYDERFNTGELKTATNNKVVVRGKDGNCFMINKTDSRWVSGELKGATKGFPGHKSFLGKKHKHETKKIMSEKASERKGEKNSQYGTCWVTNGSENKKIKKENLEEWLKKGYNRGRK